jgi:hypothetical protein
MVRTSAIRSHHTPTSSGDWDGPEAEVRLGEEPSVDKMKRLFAWMDPAKPESKTAYKFPHHDVSARGKVGAANEKACISGISILNGGRGGADIPDADRKQIYRHLATHLKDAGREPPELK